MYWAADAGPDDDDLARPVLAGDISRRHIVVDDAEPDVTPVLLEYDDNDRFNVAGEPVSLAVFESVLADELKLEVRTRTWNGATTGPAAPARHRVQPDPLN